MTNNFVIPAPNPVVVAVQGGGLFPVRRIFCVGRNYAAHAREMGANPDREPPFFFTKPADAVLPDGADMPYPPMTQSLHHEIELVVAIGAGGADITPDAAPTHVFGYAVGLDMTRRDLQSAAKQAGQPWDMAKGFDHSAPVSAILPAAQIGHPDSGRIALRVNGKVRQEGDVADMIWNVPETIAALSRLVRLAPGDLIFTGTPEGVGTVQRGDVLEGEIENLAAIRTRIV